MYSSLVYQIFTIHLVFLVYATIYLDRYKVGRQTLLASERLIIGLLLLAKGNRVGMIRSTGSQVATKGQATLADHDRPS